jgi:catechol 2,3-dioxygenase-like lactoylglutathione lyase family enzyme
MKISRLVLYTKNLNLQTEFYESVLGVEIINESKTSAELKFGATILELNYSSEAKPYHFAINIPSNQEHEALAWLKERVKVLTYQGEELVDFINWNAKSVYFYDADKNIVELIARKNLNINSNKVFNAQQFLSISEIGMSVTNVSHIYHQINLIKTVPLYFGNLDWFCAAGDEHGLFIIIKQSKKGWLPNNDFAYTADFKLRGDVNFDFVNGKIIKFIK